MRRKPLASSRLISLMWSCLCVFFLVSCGPCASLRRDFDERWRFELQHLALGERIDVSQRPHLRVDVSATALELLSSLALKEHEAFTRSSVLPTPAGAWGRAGNINLEMDIRVDRISTVDRSDAMADTEVELTLSTTVQARFEIPGKRARWSWNARAAVRVPIFIDPQDPTVVVVSFEEAELLHLEDRLPWEVEEVPNEIGDIVSNGIASSIEAMLLENQDARLRVVRVETLNLSRVSLPVRLSSLVVNSESGGLELGVVTALRPVWTERTGTKSTYPPAPAGSVSVHVPSATLDAAIRQKSLRGATPMTITLAGGPNARRWTALWGASTMKGGVWEGRWDLWCFEGTPCRHRSFNAQARAWAQNGVMVAARDALPREFGDEGSPEGAGVASLAELQRMTMSEFTMSVIRGLLNAGSNSEILPTIEDIRLDDGVQTTTFSIR